MLFYIFYFVFFFFSSRRRHTRSLCDWSSDVCSSDLATLRGVEVRRFGKVVATFDLYDYLLRGNTRHDVRLETGDVVFVPVHEIGRASCRERVEMAGGAG